MTIKHEVGKGYALVTCTDCPPWRRLTGSRTESLSAAATHVELAHGDAERARRLRELAERKRRRDTPTFPA